MHNPSRDLIDRVALHAEPPADLVRLAGLPDEIYERIRQLEAEQPPGAVEFAHRLVGGEDVDAVVGDLVDAPAKTAGRDQAVRLLKTVRQRVVDDAERHIRTRGNGELIELLQPVHSKLVAGLDKLLSDHPHVVDLNAEQATQLAAADLRAWRRRRELNAEIADIEALADELLGVNSGMTVDNGSGGRVSITLNEYGETYWDGLPPALADKFARNASPYNRTPGGLNVKRPTWDECRRAGATRVIRTRSQAIAAAIQAHNDAAERSVGVDVHGLSKMRPLPLPAA